MGVSVKRSLILVLTVLLVVFCFAGIAAASSKDTLLIGKGTEALGMDPQDLTDTPSEEVCHSIYEGLVSFDEEMKIQPRLATSWDISEDGKTWTFHLREGVTFHSGTPFNAEAVKKNFDRILSGKYKRSSLYAPIVDSVEVKDEYTVVFNLKTSFGAFLNILSHTAGLILDPKGVDENRDFVRNPSGTGAFMLDEWLQGDYIALKAYDKYWGGKPKLKKVIFKTIPEDSARAMMMETGEIDVAEQVPPQDVARLKESKKIDMRIGPSVMVQFLALNCQDEILKDVKVRQAIFMAIDREAICKNIMMGFATPVNSMVAPLVNGYSEVEGLPYNPEKAKALLAEAGWKDSNGDGILEKDGKTLHVKLLTHGRNTPALKIPEAVQAYLSKIGMDAKMAVMDWGTFLAETRKPVEENTSQVIYYGWSPSTGDADWVYRPLTLSDQWVPNGANRTFYANKEVDEAVMMGFSSVDQEVRRQAYARAQTIMNEEVPWVPIYTRSNLTAVNRGVHDIMLIPLDFVKVTNTTYKD
ncbi:MAG: glutathione ABC transporter substrate-binding protein [Aminobacterium sp.]|jgi:nickel ABC transporter nickel/metallophore binding protein|uniref:glutathione ABC transporter substrate-binding protein n=3 Tax=unclassified Aminobacterium TaxID=2685012 RepID=UPI001BCC268D|nr:glutathione ABC transporter substrate-binding protein [Aminobacterium sp. MB27-C1]MDD2206068.1 glutathione ABC transporter substrate-binding protein [Aminobacterium sp.]MDD3426183.1 glutathione ABC transporter substrate-binding protein [Aminobacterium sp.]MDD3707625.1 glutathione ABC transporter substrate-binding protein [Aminobacterium sp.]MDD4227775.1 glutathione ABC transporter substrate-binding protein [Aminobacterium sp.]MDD4550785.1 glutathione ABC transporter substrate-binding protei